MLPDCQVRLVTHLLEPEGGEGKNYKKGYKHGGKLETKTSVGYLQICHIEQFKAQSHNATETAQPRILILLWYVF